MSNQHTAGPWNVGWSHWSTDEEIAYGINRGKGTVSNEEAVANARLIAAAPELLSALQNLQRELHSAVKFDVKKHYSLMIADASANKVIAKAVQS